MAGSFSEFDHRCMARALRLAENGLLTTTPNPRVGCVIVSEGEIVGEGWHVRAGEQHAEALALELAGSAARGATAYVSLEPCNHHGRTPPCTEALLAAGVTRVVAAMEDPNPQVAGQGLAFLRRHGVKADCGLLEDAARELNLGFVARMTRRRPWLRLKMAASLDGRTALQSGASQWLTGRAARQDGHRWRARACAILTGIGTVRHDDPQLNVRGVEAAGEPLRQPLKVVVDSRLNLPPAARLLKEGKVLVAAALAEPARVSALQRLGAEVVCLPGDDGRVDLPALCAQLAQRGINELHVEAGPTLGGALLEAALVDECLLYLAPCLLGDTARGLFRLPLLDSLDKRTRLSICDLRMVGSDLRLLARLN